MEYEGFQWNIFPISSGVSTNLIWIVLTFVSLLSAASCKMGVFLLCVIVQKEQVRISCPLNMTWCNVSTFLPTHSFSSRDCIFQSWKMNIKAATNCNQTSYSHLPLKFSYDRHALILFGTNLNVCTLLLFQVLWTSKISQMLESRVKNNLLKELLFVRPSAFIVMVHHHFLFQPLDTMFIKGAYRHLFACKKKALVLSWITTSPELSQTPSLR